MYFIISYNDHLFLLPYTVGMGEEMVIFAVFFSRNDETRFHQGRNEISSGVKRGFTRQGSDFNQEWNQNWNHGQEMD